MQWLTLPVTFALAFYGAMRIVNTFRPDVVASVGGYTAVPVILAAKLLGARVWVHQQDVAITLTNRLTSPLADRLTVAWQQSLRALPSKARWVGNPVRPSLKRGSPELARERFGITADLPTVLVFGGGSGAQWINGCLAPIVMPLCVRANVIHLTGKGNKPARFACPNYFAFEFLDGEMADALALSDVVVCRAGMGSLTELAALAKPAVVIPLPHSAQEGNARAAQEACVVLDQDSTQSGDLLAAIVDLLDHPDRRVQLGKKMSALLRTDVSHELARMLLEMPKPQQCLEK